MAVSDYTLELCKHYTVCKCGVKLEWEAVFSSTDEWNAKYISEKFGWTLRPPRCPDCIQRQQA